MFGFGQCTGPHRPSVTVYVGYIGQGYYKQHHYFINNVLQSFAECCFLEGFWIAQSMLHASILAHCFLRRGKNAVIRKVSKTVPVFGLSVSMVSPTP